MIIIDSISKWFGSFRVLDSVSFDVKNGEIIGFVGPNGAGKTTTIRVCVGVLPLDSGDVFINGYSIKENKRVASRYIGWVPEIPIFEPDEKALNYFIYLAGYYGIGMSEARELGRKLLEEVGLGDAMKVKLKNFSLGMKKRFALAVSMINNPDNFLFDEVLNGLDPVGMAFFRDLVKKFKKDNKAVLFSSHILKEVEDIVDRVVFINKGRVAKVMTIDEVKTSLKPVLIVKLRTLDDKAIDIARDYGESVRVEKNSIYIINPRVEPANIIEAFVRSGYKVEEVKKEEASLEEVFFRIIGETK
ncbi:MAG: ABC transporter ATP-binding protein [Ignisphaera sp.]|uniref:ABC transporter ATP-binding protein n=1 Tax=Ignisphaera aggregans TaxID=334771 RepID=A0A7C4NQE5_9CREN